MTKDEAQKIAQDFLNSLNAGDKGLIEQYSLETLRMALPHYEHWQRNQPWHQEILRYIDELQRKEEKKQDQGKIMKEKVELAILAFLLGVLGILITQGILSLFR
ncbi:MAG: hypothetical protein KKH29_02840 [Candidatus Omnitrophica bacterium]|nr:hypothetical protein [Candidatus Omnitrophota bacterium]